MSYINSIVPAVPPDTIEYPLSLALPANITSAALITVSLYMPLRLDKKSDCC